MPAPTTLYKITFFFLAINCTMHLFVNQWFMDLNFENIGVMDDKHNFFARNMGLYGLFYAGLLVQLDEAAAASVFPYQTLFIVLFYVLGPITASGLVFEPIKGMHPPKADFWPGLVPFTALVLAYIYTLVTGGYRTKGAKTQ